jgi:hypothetical protein
MLGAPDIAEESTFEGNHTPKVVKGLSFNMHSSYPVGLFHLNLSEGIKEFLTKIFSGSYVE